MIVAALEIENYKHYAGAHRIEFPEHGMISVTGPNGAGKTTLFEAIEWCLYCPRTIPRASIPPHDGVGRTVVRVTLEDAKNGDRYCVQRELRASGTQAEVYREDQPEQPLVQGTREVTRYVAKELIGLPYGAFVSTFFTKQKELQFFADRSATDRRIEVGKLLGLEAVREAQREMGEGRTAARSRADALRGEYERRLDARDLAAEAAEATSAVQEAVTREAEADQIAQAAVSEAEGARAEMNQLRDLQAEDAAIAQRLATLAGEAAAATARRDGALAQLARLEARAGERMKLAEAAAHLVRLAGEVERLEEARERARELQRQREAQRTAAERECAVARRLEQIVAEHRDAARGLTGWTWTAADAADPGAAVSRLRDIAVSRDPKAQRDRFERMQAAVQASLRADELAAQLVKLHRQRDKLTLQREDLLASGDPAGAVAEAARDAREARHEDQVARMAMAAARVEREEDERLVAGLRQHMEDPICPTCTRPLGPKEAERLAALLDEKIRALVAAEQAHLDLAEAATRQVGAAERAELEARKRLDAVRSLAERLSDGQAMIEEAEARHGEAAERLRAALDAISAVSIPSTTEIEEARHDTECTQRIAALAGLLNRLHEEAVSARQAQDDAKASIQEMGEVAFDDGQLQQAAEALRQARRAAAQVELIDVELENRGLYEQQRAKEAHELESLQEQHAAIAAERGTLGFDPAQLIATQHREQAALAAAHAAREAHAAARQAVRESQAERNRVAADHEQLQKLIEEADRSAREADELTRMYDEFGEFDRYVARHVGPLLAETTERMLSQVTNGKYDHVQFDENYGIEVFDGDESFPISSFSGGERDVVSLCARLALSEVVGSAAMRPPRFLVLDEVFGSLDSERRAQLLETLGALANSGHFQQMFIISHVDDVQQSPAMSEAWTIVERDGVSRVVRQGEAELAALSLG